MKAAKTVIVTGASRGIGAAVARWLGKNGSAVVIVARSEAALSGVAGDIERLGGKVLPLCEDIAEQNACRRIIAKTLARFKKLDALVNNAGIVAPLKPIAMADENQWRYNIAVNLLAPFYLTRAAIPELRKQNGRVINVSSGAADIPIHSASAYCAAKAALTHFTRVLAEEESLLTSIAVGPGVVDTGMQEFMRNEGPKVMPPEQYIYYQEIKIKGLLTPPDVPARSIAWLALKAPPEFNAKFLSFDDPRIINPARRFFGRRL